jgi:hypothetical protein
MMPAVRAGGERVAELSKICEDILDVLDTPYSLCRYE